MPREDVFGNFFKSMDAPEVPTHNFFTLEATTVEVSGITSENLGNQLIGLLESEHTMNILKISERKFSIKAEFVNPLWVVLKLRIYSRAPSHIIEFQRYKGDTLAFHQFFERVAALLSRKPKPAQTACDVVPPNAMCTAPLQPFLEMAMGNSDPFLLGEAACGLANAFMDPQSDAELCTQEAFSAFEGMLRTGGYNILQPLAQLLSRLVMNIKAAPFFADQVFWQALLDVVIAPKTCDKLKTQFVCVVNSALGFGASQEQLKTWEAANEATNVARETSRSQVD